MTARDQVGALRRRQSGPWLVLPQQEPQAIHRRLPLQPFGVGAGVGPQRINMVNLAPEQRVGQQEVADLGPFQGCLLYPSRCV